MNKEIPLFMKIKNTIIFFHAAFKRYRYLEIKKILVILTNDKRTLNSAEKRYYVTFHGVNHQL